MGAVMGVGENGGSYSIDLPAVLGAKVFYNTELKVFSSKNKNTDNFSASKKLSEYLLEKSNGDIKRYSGLEEKTGFLFNFPRIQSFLLEKIGGYTNIN